MKMEYPKFPSWFLTLVVVVTATAFSLIVFPGYSPYAGDHRLYIPPILAELNPGALSRDFLTVFSQNDLTTFDEFLIWTMKLTGMSLLSTMFVLMAFFRALFLFGFYRVVLFFTKHKAYSLYSMIFLIGAHHVIGNTAGPPMDNMLLPRNIVLAIGTAFLAPLLMGRLIVPAIGLAASAHLHLPTAAIFILIWLAMAVRLAKHRPKSVLVGLATLGISAFYLMASSRSGDLGLFTRFDAIWLDDVIRSAGYIFITQWPIKNPSFIWQFSVSLFFIWMIFKRVFQANDERRASFLVVTAVPLVAALISLTLVDAAHMALPAMVQFARAFVIWKLIIPPLVGWYAWILWRKDGADELHVFLLVGTSVSFWRGNEHLLRS